MKKYHPDATIFFNSGGANPKKTEFHAYQSHFEMEDLPTAWGGYDKLPLRAKFFANSGKHLIGMTGKFHLDWGEFGGFKSGEALKYEVATMAMYGAGASVGDHMHP
ncbi:MAG: alpha-amylase, partial [Clostridia bacterium]|nr:alpha-amylase [Clostridia bacterium]